MRLGIIADTHGLLRPEVFAVFEGVDRILHAGDVGELDLLTGLEAIAPVTAVWGNTDGFDLRSRLPEVVEIRIEGFDFLLLHGHQLGIPSPEKLNRKYPSAEVIVFGHTHKPLLGTPASDLTPAWLRLDPIFTPLKGNPRFEKLIAAK